MFISLNPGTIVRRCDDQSILLLNTITGASMHCTAEAYEYISPVTTHPKDIDEIVAAISLKYDQVSKTELTKDIHDFYNQASSLSLISIGDTISDVSQYNLSSLHVEITFACNERCIHCYIPEKTKDVAPIIDAHLFKRLIDEFVELGGKEVTLSGGEPMLHPSFKEFALYCRDKELTVNIFSNLILCDVNMINFLTSINPGVIQTSVYSMNPMIHDKITKVTGSLKKTLKALDRLSKSGIECAIACPIMNINKSCGQDIIQYARENRFRLRMNPMLMAGSNMDLSPVANNRLSTADHRNLLSELLYCDAGFVKTNLLEIDLDIEKALLETPSTFLNRHICSAAIDHICVSATGNYYPCPGWESYSVGNLKTDSLHDIWFTNNKINALRAINKMSAFPQCIECTFMSYCKRCFLQSTLEGEFGKFNHRTCEDAEMRKDILQRFDNVD